ncbi:MAG: SDR family NAD(P)-dependent oxidoreductase [Candidatus Protochlamydia sp.]|nr:SDR family NAD(P)-dependent oxidoreductase [Candidatus Protochlamydia sp.]
MVKNVLITGGAGFIGFHLARHLTQRGDRVLGYDNFNSYYDPLLKHARAEELANMGVHTIQGDILNAEELEKHIIQHQTTHLIHLAAQAGVRYSIQEPKAYLKTNIDGFLNILEICRAHPAIKLIYASSSTVYGLNKKVPFSIEDKTDQQANLYGVTKKTNELMAQAYHHLFGISSIGLRFFTVYGPWGRPDMAYFSFANAIVQGKPIEIFNRGEMKRDFTYIDDIVEGILAAIDRNIPFGLFNLGSHKPVPLLRFVAILEKELGLKAQKVLMPMQLGDVVSTYADIEESAKQLGFIPKTTIEEGLAAFVKWYKGYYSCERCKG